MRYSILSIALIAVASMTTSADAQSIISDRDYEFTAGGGLWAPLLPSYSLGTTTAGGPAYFDNLDDVGGILQLKGVRRFLWTRTSVEAKGFFAAAGSENNRAPTGVSILSPATGGALASALSASARLDSEVLHYGGDIGLRDTWRTPFGGLSAGCLFSYMRFDQDFDVDLGTTNVFREQLDSEFRGGKAVFGWEGFVNCRPTNLDIGIGIYDLNTYYQYDEHIVANEFQHEWAKTTTTFEASLTTRANVRDLQVGLTLGMMYLSDMPQIVRNVGTPISIRSDDAVTLTAMLEVLL